MSEKQLTLRPCAIALAMAMASGLSACGGGGGSNVRPLPNANGNVEYNSNSDAVWSTTLHGKVSLIKDGRGTLTLTGANDYVGGTSINAGTLRIGNGGTSGSIVGDVKNNGTLVFDRGDDWLFAGNISGSGAVEQTGTGIIYLTGTNTYQGGTTISDGTLKIGDGGTNGSITGDVVDNGSLIFDRSDDVVFGGKISGTGSLGKEGFGKLILTGDSTYTGQTAFNNGTLQIGNGGTTGSIIGDIVNGSYYGSLIFDRSNDWTYRGVISGSGGMVKLGTGTLAFGGENTYTGATAVKAGTLKILAGGRLGQTAITVGGADQSAALEIAKGGTVSSTVVLDVGGTLDNAGVLHAARGYNGPVTVVNHDGGLIEGDASQTGSETGVVLLGAGSSLTNGVGSTIRGYVGVQSAGVVNNIGGTITGLTRDGVDDAAVVNNRDGASIVGGVDGSIYSRIAMGVRSSATGAIINNLDGSTIQGVYRGIDLNDGGIVTNDNGSTISGRTGITISSMSSATATVNNIGGSKIAGTQAGIVLSYGGTVNNGPGSTIEATATGSGDCSVTLACGVYVPVYSAIGNYGSVGTLTLINAGRIVGNVQMDPSLANDITLMAGGSIQGDLAIGTNAQSTLALDGSVGTTQSYSDAVTGTTTFGGKLIKNGGGTWIIDDSGLQSVTDTAVNAGSLRATLTLSGNVTVGVSGRLDGVPGIAGDLANAGAVAVHGGNTTVGGNYAQAATGTLAVSLGSKLDVGGTATLNGGTLEITGADSGYVSNTHTDVLTAAGGVSGTFDRLVKDSGVVFTATTINYDGNSVWLDTTGLDVTTAAAGEGVSYTPVTMASAVRVQGTFDQLDHMLAADNLSDVSGDFLSSAGQFQQAPTLQAAQASLQSLSGELHAVSVAMTFEAIDASSRALSDRFDSLLDKGTGVGMWTHNLSLGGGMARAGFDGVDFQLDGWLVGSDRSIGSSGVAGFAFGQSRGQQRLSRSFDRDTSRNTDAMLYTGRIDGNSYMLGRVGFGHFQQDVSRQVLLGYSMQGVGTRYDGRYSTAYGESGMHFNRAGGHLTPFIDVQYARVGRDGFAEQGAGGFGLRSNAQMLDRWQAGFGVRARQHWELSRGRAVEVSARAQWQRTLASHGGMFDASFVGLEQWQPLLGIGLSRYRSLFGVGLDATLSRHAALNFNYDYQNGQRDTAQMLSASLSVAF